MKTLKDLWDSLTKKNEPVQKDAETHALIDDGIKNGPKYEAQQKQVQGQKLLASLKPGQCPKCHMISHHPMDQFFKWCANCDLNYSGVVYQNWQRAELGQIHEEFPDYTLKEVVEFYHSMQ
jgi:hypothetical protein